MSCHTANIMGYFIEGHGPSEDIKRLITERPNALGLAVPGMPYGSPGMGPETEREAYDVFIIRKMELPKYFNIILKLAYLFGIPKFCNVFMYKTRYLGPYSLVFLSSPLYRIICRLSRPKPNTFF